MPYIKRNIDYLNNKISDFGWEVGNIEYDIDMILDEEECPMAIQEQYEIESNFVHKECLWNKDLKK